MGDINSIISLLKTWYLCDSCSHLPRNFHALIHFFNSTLTLVPTERFRSLACNNTHSRIEQRLLCISCLGNSFIFCALMVSADPPPSSFVASNVAEKHFEKFSNPNSPAVQSIRRSGLPFLMWCPCSGRSTSRAYLSTNKRTWTIQSREKVLVRGWEKFLPALA